jgi:hypothetical protein
VAETLRLPPEIAQSFIEGVRARRRTVHDVRRFLAPLRGRLLAFGMDDGVYQDATLWGYYEDVVHSPGTGFQLILRGLIPIEDRELRRRDPRRAERITRPLSVFTALPAPLAFLTQAPEVWPFPPPLQACSNPACGCRHNAGRFCGACGRLLHRRRWLGEGYAVMQQVIRAAADADPALARACGCGAVVLSHVERYCGKCGIAAGGQA